MTTDLQETWKSIFQKRLPAAARAKDPAQDHWPVHVDHCFARIILDKIVGGGSEPWIGKLKTPAYKNMSHQQLEAAIALGEDILEGRADLVELDRSSLVSRGKAVKKGSVVDKRKREESGKVEARKRTKQLELHGDEDEGNDKQITKNEEDDEESQSGDVVHESEEETGEDKNSEPKNETANTSSSSQKTKLKRVQNGSISKYFSAQVDRKKSSTSTKTIPSEEQERLSRKIATSNKTDFQKQVLALLLQIPPGRYSTYGHLSKYLNSSPRAVGNALRNNPFAPDVPCHRVLATGGGIGGFGGSWGKGGKAGENDHEKRRLLNEEGIQFDGKGRAVGQAFDRFSQP